MWKLLVYSGIMNAVREAWTDERLDDLTRRMDQGFERVDKDIRELRAELKGEMNARFNRVDDRFDRIDARFDSLQRMLLAAYVTAVLGLIATQL